MYRTYGHSDRHLIPVEQIGFSVIISLLDSSARYSPLSPLFATGISYLKDLDFGAPKPGRNDIEGDALYAMCQK